MVLGNGRADQMFGGSMDIDFKVAQLLASRLCHDLAGGIGALTTGAELLAEEGGAPDSEAIALISMSAQQTAHRLQFLRLAFGQGGGEDGRVALVEVSRAVNNYLSGSRTSLVWDAPETRIELGAGKLLANLCLIGAECLPRGGILGVEVTALDDRLGFAVAACGNGARLEETLKQALDANVDVAVLTPRTVHAHYAALLARELGAELEIASVSEEEVRLAALTPGS